MRAVIAKFVGATRESSRLSDFWRPALVAAIGLVEIFVITAVFDFYPPTGFSLWLNPALYINTLAKLVLVAGLLFVLVAWPRRDELAAEYARIGSDGLKPSLLASLPLLAGIVACRYLLSAGQLPFLPLSLLYSGLIVAIAATMVLAVAPPRFWRRLVALAPTELLVSVACAVAVIIAAALTQEGWDTLSGATLTLSHWFLSLYEPNAWALPEHRILAAGDFKVQVFGACSGYEGVALIVVFLSVYMWVFRRELRFPNVLLLLPIGVAVVWCLNALRIAVLVSIGAHISPAVAIQGFHSAAGWICFLLVTFGCIAISRRVPFFFAPAGSQEVPSGSRGVPIAAPAAAPPRPAVLFLAPFVALMAASILESAFAPHDQWLYGARVAAIGGVLWWYRRDYLRYLSSVSPAAILVGVAVGAVWIMTDPGKSTEAPLGTWLASLPLWVAVLWLVLRAVGSVVMVPIAEELAFRGYLARALVSRRFENVGFGDFRWLAFIGSSVAFGMVHQRWMAAFLAGAIYALLMYRSKNIADPIAAHAASNATLIFWAVAAQQWSLL